MKTLLRWAVARRLPGHKLGTLGVRGRWFLFGGVMLLILTLGTLAPWMASR